MNDATTPPKRRLGRRLLRIAGFLVAAVIVFDVWDRCYHPVFFGISSLIRILPWSTPDYPVDFLTPCLKRARSQGFFAEVMAQPYAFTNDDGAVYCRSQTIRVGDRAGTVRELAGMSSGSAFAICDGVIYREQLDAAPGIMIEEIDFRSGVTNWAVDIPDLCGFGMYYKGPGIGYQLTVSQPGRLLLHGCSDTHRALILLDTARTTNGNPVFLDIRSGGTSCRSPRPSTIDRFTASIWRTTIVTRHWIESSLEDLRRRIENW